MKQIAISRIALGFAILFAFSLASCSGADSAQNDACRAKTPPGSRLPWAYYPGYGYGPLTPEGRGVFSG